MARAQGRVTHLQECHRGPRFKIYRIFARRLVQPRLEHAPAVALEVPAQLFRPCIQLRDMRLVDGFEEAVEVLVQKQRYCRAAVPFRSSINQ